MSRRFAALSLMLALVSCGSPSFSREDLARIVLQEKEAPQGTVYIASSSGYKSLDEYARTDQIKLVAMQDAGFITSYFSFFLSKGFADTGGIAPTANLADSFALLFETPEGASAGLKALEEAVHRDGKDLVDRAADELGEEGFAVKGTLQVGLPPGFLYAWRVGNAVFGLVAAGAPGRINEEAVRVLVDRMRARTG